MLEGMTIFRCIYRTHEHTNPDGSKIMIRSFHHEDAEVLIGMGWRNIDKMFKEYKEKGLKDIPSIVDFEKNQKEIRS